MGSIVVSSYMNMLNTVRFMENKIKFVCLFTFIFATQAAGSSQIPPTLQKKHTREISDVSIDLFYEVLSLIKKIVTQDASNEDIQKLKDLREEVLDVKILPDDLSLSIQDYDQFFSNILDLDTQFPGHVVLFLWKLFVIQYGYLDTSDDIQAEPTTPNAAIYFSKNFKIFEDDLHSKPKDAIVFQNLISSHADILLTDPLIKHYMEILLSPVGDEDFKVNIMIKLFQSKDGPEKGAIVLSPELGTRRKSRTTNYHNLYRTIIVDKLLEGQTNPIRRMKLILNMIKNEKSINFQFGLDMPNNLETTLTNKWISHDFCIRIVENIKQNARFNFELYDFVSENSGNSILEKIKNKLSDCLMDEQIRLEDRINIFINTIILFSGKELGYIVFALRNYNNNDVLEAIKFIKPNMDNIEIGSKIDLIGSSIDFLDISIRLKFENNGVVWFYDFFKNTYIKNLIKNKTSKLNPLMLPSLYRDYFQQYSKMIFSNLPGIQFEKRETYPALSQEFGKVIYNQEGYTKNQKGEEDIQDLPLESEIIKKGNPLILRNYKFINEKDEEHLQDIPIGYNIYLPKNEIKGAIVRVYGGNQASDRASNLKMPLSLDFLDHYLLKQGIVVIYLNLLDFLELNDYQMSMPESLHNKLHASIHHFLQVIRTQPETIFPDLTLPNDIKIILYGESFGGMLSIRHAELFPQAEDSKSFDGYISHDGWLSPKIGELGDPTLMSSHILNSNLIKNPQSKEYPPSAEPEAEKWLSPIGKEKVDCIQQPILLLHNFDDNNVNVKVCLDFFKEALKSGKENLVHLLITRRGNPIPNTIDPYEKGHGISRDTHAFENYARTVAFFILEGPPKSSTVSKWMAHQYEIYANKNYKMATFEELFISEAYRLYKSSYYRPKVIPGEGGIQTKQKIDSDDIKFENFWVNKGELLYYTLKYLRSFQDKEEPLQMIKACQNEMEDLENNGLLADEDVERTLLYQLPDFFDYLREYFGYIINHDIDLGTFLKNQDLKDEFRNSLMNNQNDPDFAFYQLQTLYLANPGLMKKRMEQLTKVEEFAGLFAFDSGEILEAKENLRQRILADKQFVIERLREMGKLE